MSDKLTPAQLDEIEATAKDARRSQWRWPKFDDLEQVNGHIGAHSRHIAMMDPATTLALIAEVRDLRAKVERVRELHRENAYPDRPVSRCRDCDDVWPCETARALGEEA